MKLFKQCIKVGISLTVACISFCVTPVSASAPLADSSIEDIGNEMFGYVSPNNAALVGCKFNTTNTGYLDVYVTNVFTAIDPRITGAFNISYRYSGNNGTPSESITASGTYVSVAQNGTSGTISDLNGPYPRIFTTLTYTPSAQDIAYGVHILKSVSPAWKDAGAAINVNWSGALAGTNNGFDEEPVAGKEYTFSCVNGGFGIALNDLYNYLSTGNVKQPQTVTVTSPISKTYNNSTFNLNATIS